MKRIGITLLTLLMACMAMAQQGNAYKSMDNPRVVRLITIDSLSEIYFGEELTDLLKQAQSIEIYKLSHYLNEKPTDLPSLEDFRILDTATLNKNQQQQIGGLLTSSESYIADKNIKKPLPFYARFGFKNKR